MRRRRIEIELAEVKAVGDLYEEAAPKTCYALWQALPIEDRAVHVKWSGDAWRTEGDYALVDTVENEGHILSAGDIIYYPRMKKIGVAYGLAEWRHPDPSFTLHVSVIGKITTGLEAFCAASERVWSQGFQPVAIRRLES